MPEEFHDMIQFEFNFQNLQDMMEKVYKMAHHAQERVKVIELQQSKQELHMHS